MAILNGRLDDPMAWLDGVSDDPVGVVVSMHVGEPMSQLCWTQAARRQTVRPAIKNPELNAFVLRVGPVLQGIWPVLRSWRAVRRHFMKTRFLLDLVAVRGYVAVGSRVPVILHGGRMCRQRKGGQCGHIMGRDFVFREASSKGVR